MRSRGLGRLFLGYANVWMDFGHVFECLPSSHLIDLLHSSHLSLARPLILRYIPLACPTSMYSLSLICGVSVV